MTHRLPYEQWKYAIVRAGVLCSALLLLASSLTVIIGPAKAQVLFGSIVGNVTDATGAAVPGATVRVSSQQTNETREVTTNDAGGYVLSTLPAGTYRVSVTKTGFRTFNAEETPLNVNTVVRVDAVLQLGAQTETVTVTAASAPLQTDRADVHGEFTPQQIAEIPQPTRTYEGLLQNMPGIAPPTANGGGNNNPGKSFQITANGTSRSGTNVRIDGVTDTNAWVQFYSTYVPSNEAIQVVNVVTTSPDAEQGLTNGAAINVQTKSGTNQLHGALFEYNINKEFSARPFFLPASQGIPKLIENDLGGSLGGRIIKDKLFFFGSYEGDFISQAGSNTVSVPTADIRSGNMGASSTPMYDPASTTATDGSGRTPFPGNTIPANRISPITQKLVALVPQPNLGAPGALANNYYITTPIANRLHKLDTKLDWNTSSKLKFTGRFGFQPYNIQQATVFGDILGGGNSKSQYGDVIATAAAMTYVATPTFVVDGNWGFTRANQVLSPPSVDQKLGADYLGIPGVNLGQLPLAGGMPNFNPSGWTGYGESYPYLHYLDPIFQYTSNASWIKGSHNIRFGIDISQQHMNHQEVQPTSFTFNGGATSLKGGLGSNQFNGYADFLLGLPQSYQNSEQDTPWITLRTWQYSLYIRDQWQINRKLTLSYGTRWEYYPVPTRADRGIESFNLATGTITVCGVAGNPKDCGITVSKRLFSPRLGIAYRPTEKLVIRTGFSLSPEQINMYRDGIYSYPARTDFAGNGLTTYTPVGTLATGIPVTPQPDLSSGTLPVPPGLNFGFQGAVLPQNFVRGYTESWNFTIQRDLGHSWIGQVGYVGTHTVHQHTRYNINYGQVGGGSVSQPYFPLGIAGNMAEILPYETMHYNSLQASLQRRFSNGFLFQAAYTRSKWIGTCCDDSGDGGPAIPLPQYTALNRALMGGDRPDNLRLIGIYELPFGNGKTLLNHGAGEQLLGGWQLNAAFSAYSGSPFSVSASGNSLNAPGSTQRADQVLANVSYSGSIDSWFNPLAFAPVTQARFGTAGFDTLRGPGVVDLDLGLSRTFKIGEKWSAQFRAEALNATNTPHFRNPSSNVSNLSLNGDGTVKSLGGFTQITAVSAPSRLTDERYLRLGLRISF
ncbi:MAG TPA: TonB-dependent receptor [Bryobacteraceae bacterium]|nr:TonB-dependent receptor [Bryobacteraceae bacterium]